MISYDTYQNKIKRIAAIKNFIVRFRALFIALFALLLALVTAFIFTKGIITQDIVLPEKIVYGDDYFENIRQPKALFSDVGLEFAVADGTPAKMNRRSSQADGNLVWTKEFPTVAGNYFVRTVSQKTFGVSYGAPKEFKIETLPIEFKILSDSAIYGELPENFVCNLINGDRLVKEAARVSYDNPELDSTFISSVSFKVLDKNGNDVSFCYDITVPEKVIALLPRDITLTPSAFTSTYIGKQIDYESTLTQDSIDGLYGDSAHIETKIFDGAGNALDGFPVNAGVYTIQIVPDKTSIKNGSADVLSHYNVTYATATFTVEPRPVTVTTQSATKVYDGTPFVQNGYAQTGLIEGHTLLQSQPLTEKTDAGVYINEYTFTVFDGSEEVTSNYRLTYDYGMLEITRRPITLTTVDRTKIYDGTLLSESEFKDYTIDESAFVTGHKHTVNYYSGITEVAQSGALNEVLISVYDAENSDVTRNYQIISTFGKLEIQPREITVTSSSDGWVYDGAKHSNANIVDITCNGDNAPLADGEEIYASYATQVIYFTAQPVENIISCTVSRGGRDVTDNYLIEYVNGTLAIDKRPVILTTPTITKVYDGLPLYGDSKQVIADNLAASDVVRVVGEVPRITDFGKTENALQLLIINAGIDATESYEISVVKGELSILKRDVTVYTPTDEKIYDGTPLLGDAKQAYADNLAAGQQLLAFDVAQITLSGGIKNTTQYKIVNSRDEFTSNYNINYEHGTLTVHKREIIVETPTAEKEYDGSPFTKTGGWKILPEYDLVEGHTLTVDESVTPTSVTAVSEGAVDNKVSYKVFCGADDLSANYQIKYIHGKLSITPRVVSVLTASGEWVFENALFSNPDAEAVRADGVPFVLGHNLKVSFTFEVIYVNTYDNACEYMVVDSDGADQSVNYKLEMTYGKLRIIPRPVLITTQSGNAVYDDNPFSYAFADAEPFNAKNGSGLCAGHEIVHDTDKKTASVTYVTEGEVENEHYYKICNGDKDLTGNYDIKYSFGVIFVTQRPITVTTQSGDKEFDGLPYSAELPYADMVTEGLIVEGHAFKVVGTFPSVTFVTEGEVENKVEYAVIRRSDIGDDLTENYKITYVYGHISRTVRYVEVVTATASWVYDGQAHSDTSYTDAHLTDLSLDVDGQVISGTTDGQAGLVLSHKLTATAFTTVTDYTETPVENKVGYIVENEDINKNYCLHIVHGSLSIGKRPIIITTATAVKIYDGDPLSKTDGWLVEGGEADGAKLDFGLVNGHSLGLKLGEDGQPTQVTYMTDVLWQDGKPAGIENKVEYDVFDGAENVTYNYQIVDYIYGTLKRLPRPITILTSDASKTYDGKALTCDIFDYEKSNAENTRGLLESKNHEVLLDKNFAVSEITYIRLVDGNEVNSVLNERRYIISDEQITKNYYIIYDYGTLTIKKRSLTITTPDISWNYDGNYHYGDDEKGKPVFDNLVTVNEISEYATAHSPTKIIDYIDGGLANKTQYSIHSIFGGETTYCYAIEYDYGTLAIEKIQLDITTLTANKIYDGTPLLGNDESYATPILSGLIDGETYTSYNVSEIINFGSVPNTTKYKTFANRETVNVETTQNYIINYSTGTLSIDKREITVQTATATHEYDGQKFTHPDGWEDIGELKLVAGHTLEAVEITGEITDVGTVDNVVAYKVVSNDGDVDGNYVIHYVYGELIVTPRNIRITTSSRSWTYDAAAHYDDSYSKVVHITDGKEDGEEALVLDHTLVAVSHNSIINVGKFDNLVSFIVVDENVNKNYDITYTVGEEAGKLEITARPVTVTTKSGQRVYNGEAFSLPDFTVEKSDLSGKRGIVSTHTAEKDGDAASVIYVHEGNVENVILIAISDGAGYVTENYKIEYDYGTISITPYSVTVENATLSKVYDGIKLSGGEKFTHGKLWASDYLSVEKQAEIIDVGEAVNNTTYSVFNSDGDDITDSYTLVYNEGATLTITKAQLIISTSTLKKVYDGTPLYGEKSLNSVYVYGDDAEFTGLAENETYKADSASRIINVGVAQNTTTYLIFAERDGKQVETTSNYAITYSENCGTLEVTVKPVTVITATNSAEFDGTPFSDTDNYQIVGGLAEGDSLYLADGAEYASVTFVTEGEVENRVQYSIKGRGGDVTENYFITYENGKLSITARSIEITSKDGVFGYDGQAHFEEEYSKLAHKGGGKPLVLGHRIVVKSHTGRVDAGSEDNVVKYIVENDEITKNYSIRHSYGTLSVLPRKLTVRLNEVENSVYGSEFIPLGEDPFTIVGGQTADGETLKITVTYTLNGAAVENPVNAGSYTVDLASSSIIGGRQNINNYDLSVLTSSFEIERRRITLSLTESDGKVYDGLEFVYPAELFNLVDGTFADGDTFSLAVRYSLNGKAVDEILDAGKYLIELDAASCTVNGDTALSENYQITCQPVEYEITPRRLEFKLKDIFHEYVGYVNYKFDDSEAMDYDESQVAAIDRLDVSAAIQSNGNYVVAVDVGVYDYVISKFNVVRKADEQKDVTSNYVIDLTNSSATFTIIPRKITLSVVDGGNSSEYTGSVINPDLQYSSDTITFIPGPDNEYEETDRYGIYSGDINKLHAVYTFKRNNVVCDLIELGQYTVSVSLAGDERVLNNYEVISAYDGEYRVTNRQVIVIPQMTAEWLEYDGAPLDSQYLSYTTKHNFSENEGFVDEEDYKDYKADYRIYRNGRETALQDILQAGDYYISVTLEFIGTGEPKYDITGYRDSAAFTVNKRAIRVETPNDDNKYIFDNSAVPHPQTYSAYREDGSAAFVNGDEQFAEPKFIYDNGNTYYDDARHADEYEIKIGAFNGVNGEVNLAQNYEVSLNEGIFGKVIIIPAPLVVGPVSYVEKYDGSRNTLTFPDANYRILYGRLYTGFSISFTPSTSQVNIKTLMTSVTIKSLNVYENGKEVFDYDVISDYSSYTQKLPTLPDEAKDITVDMFMAQFGFTQREVYINQYAPPEEYKVVQFGTNAVINLEDKSIPEENILSMGDGFVAGDKPEISLAMVLAYELGDLKQWILTCKVLDKDGNDVSLAYNITINCPEDSYIKVVPKDITVQIDFPLSNFSEGEVLEQGAYHLSSPLVFGENLEIKVTEGKFVITVTLADELKRNEYYNFKLIYPETKTDKKEVEYASRI